LPFFSLEEEWRSRPGFAVVVVASEGRSRRSVLGGVPMSAVGFTCCSVCSGKLHVTFFCQECGEPSCSLDCYCRHQAGHAEPKEPDQDRQQAEGAARRLEPAQ
jgi:hypothetical protein